MNEWRVACCYYSSYHLSKLKIITNITRWNGERVGIQLISCLLGCKRVSHISFPSTSDAIEHELRNETGLRMFTLHLVKQNTEHTV